MTDTPQPPRRRMNVYTEQVIHVEPAPPEPTAPIPYVNITQIVLNYETIGLPVCHWTEDAIYLWKDNPPTPNATRLIHREGHSTQEISRWMSRPMPHALNLWCLYCDAYASSNLAGGHVTKIGVELCQRSEHGDMEARRILANGPAIVKRYADYRKHEHRIHHGNL